MRFYLRFRDYKLATFMPKPAELPNSPPQSTRPTRLSVEEWEAPLEQLLIEIDHLLEDRYGASYPLHPARLERGAANNPVYDGLFHLTASFTLGLGSEYGRGYIIEPRLVTLEPIEPTLRTEIDHFVIAAMRERLPRYFPGRALQIEQDGPVIKLFGDLSLGILNIQPTPGSSE